MSLPWQGAVFALGRKGTIPACEGELAQVGLFDKNIHKMSKNTFYKSRDPSQEVMGEAPGGRGGCSQRAGRPGGRAPATGVLIAVGTGATTLLSA